MIEDKIEYKFNDTFLKLGKLSSTEISVLILLIESKDEISLNELARKNKISEQKTQVIIHDLEQQEIIKTSTVDFRK